MRMMFYTIPILFEYHHSDNHIHLTGSSVISIVENSDSEIHNPYNQ